ncbi:MAG TPA: ABC transporter substrate-binding protein [Chloroflexota bacterium]|nr:ABC transporter substrate-binding protein [Chloroflexota bacterium]
MTHPSRRWFLQGSLAVVGGGLLSGCSVPPHLAQQRSTVLWLGFLHPGVSTSAGMRTFQAAFLDGMREWGYVEGQDLLIEWRWVEGREAQLLGLAQELARLPVKAIVAVGSAISAARDATTTIPIVFPSQSDPVGSGFVASLARPGGNLTGLSAFNPQIGGKRLELLKETVPALSRLAVLWLASQPSAAGAELRALEQAAQTLDVGLLSLSVRTAQDLPPAFEAMASGRADGLISIASPLFTEWRGQLVELATKHRLPSLYPNRENVEAGGLMNYGPNIPDLYRRAATYVDKILKGARPADLPVEQPTEFDLALNLRTARALGLTIPQSVLQQATEVIQ